MILFTIAIIVSTLLITLLLADFVSSDGSATTFIRLNVSVIEIATVRPMTGAAAVVATQKSAWYDID